MPSRSNSTERMTGCPATRVPMRPSVNRIVDGLADIFARVVETDIDLVQAIVLGPALAELRPIQQALARRAAIAAAGELAVAVGAHRFRVEAEPQAANLALVLARLRERRQACEYGQACEHERKPKPARQTCRASEMLWRMPLTARTRTASMRSRCS